MTSDMNYEAIYLMRKQEIHKQTTSEHLNQWHDELMKRVVHLAIEKVEAEQGRIPAPFAFFLSWGVLDEGSNPFGVIKTMGLYLMEKKSINDTF